MKSTKTTLSEENTLLFIVELQDMLKQKTTLEKTNRFESIETKRKKVGNNIINNSWVLYNKIINNKINQEIEKRIFLINNIECDRYNENELVTVQLAIKRKTVWDLMQSKFDQFDDINLINSGIDVILSNSAQENRNKQQSTTMFLQFNGRMPNKLVLNKLEVIGKILNSEKGVLVRKSKLREILINIFNPDPRTLENYMQCLIHFGTQNGKPVNESFSEICFNMRGFLETVRRHLDEHNRRYGL